jgi:superfamily II DNA/RNA helicase
MTSLPLSTLLNKMGLNAPTSIQSSCFEPLFQGTSVCALAPTGSGKTLAFLLPLLLRANANVREIQMVILTPTRELGAQVARVCQQVLDVLTAQQDKVMLVRTAFGGMPLENQAEELSRKPAIVVATPGRLLDLLEREVFSLSHVSALVLDEADEMVGMGFAKEVGDICHRLPKKCQIALFSATQNDAVSSLQESLLRDKDVVSVSHGKEETQTQWHHGLVEHQYVICPGESKFKFVLQWLKKSEDKKVVIFCHQRETAHQLDASLKKNGVLSEALTGELGQIQRNGVMRNFKTGNLRVLVATNIAARGLDVDSLSAVLHYDIPYGAQDYVHRSGRTGRKEESRGVSIAFCLEKNLGYYFDFMKELRLDPKELPRSFFEDSGKLTSPPSKESESSVRFVRLHLNKGKQDKIRPGDVVGALVQELSLAKEDIGSIFIFQHFTHVDVNEHKKSLVLKKSFKMKNKVVKASLAQG